MLNTASPHSTPLKNNQKYLIETNPRNQTKPTPPPPQNHSKAFCRSEELGCAAPFSANIISETCNLQILQGRTFSVGVAVPVTTAGCGTDGSWLIARKPLAVSTAIIIETEASRHPERSQESWLWDCLGVFVAFLHADLIVTNYSVSTDLTQCWNKTSWRLKSYSLCSLSGEL